MVIQPKGLFGRTDMWRCRKRYSMELTPEKKRLLAAWNTEDDAIVAEIERLNADKPERIRDGKAMRAGRPWYYYIKEISQAERERIEKGEDEKALTPEFVTADKLPLGGIFKGVEEATPPGVDDVLAATKVVAALNKAQGKAFLVLDAKTADAAAAKILGQTAEKPFLPQTLDVYKNDIFWRLYKGDEKYENARMKNRTSIGKMLVEAGLVGDPAVLEPDGKESADKANPFTKLFLSLDTPVWNKILVLLGCVGQDGADKRPDWRKKATA